MRGRGSLRNNCLTCGDVYKISPSQLGKSKYCCWECRLVGMKGWQDGSKNTQWKGDDVGYRQLHGWIQSKLGKASFCVNGHKAKKYCWANASGEYKRDTSDWKPVCFRCNSLDGIKKHLRFKGKK